MGWNSSCSVDVLNTPRVDCSILLNKESLLMKLFTSHFKPPARPREPDLLAHFLEGFELALEGLEVLVNNHWLVIVRRCIRSLIK